MSKLPSAYGGDTCVLKDVTQLFDVADRIKGEMGDDYLSTEHLLLAMVDADAGRSDARLRVSTRTTCSWRSKRCVARTG